MVEMTFLSSPIEMDLRALVHVITLAPSNGPPDKLLVVYAGKGLHEYVESSRWIFPFV